MGRLAGHVDPFFKFQKLQPIQAADMQAEDNDDNAPGDADDMLIPG